MKDIKLTIEDIKKIFECFEVEGFKLLECDNLTRTKKLNYIVFTNKEYSRNYYLDMPSWIYDKYSDFLQRALEGINKKFSYSDKRSKNGYHIRYSTDSICIMNYTEMETMYSSDEDFSIDQAKIKAIKYILDKLK